MKKQLIFCLLTCMTYHVQAQFSIGLSVGANQTYWQWYIKSLDTEIGSEPAFGYRVALTADWKLSPAIGLRAELGTQVNRGYSGELTFPDLTSTARIYEHYQLWTGTTLVQVSPIKKFRAFYLVGGFTYGYTAKAWAIIKGEGPEFENDPVQKRDIDLDAKAIKRNNLLADAGLGFNIPAGRQLSLRLEGRYQHLIAGYEDHENVKAGYRSFLVNVGANYTF